MALQQLSYEKSLGYGENGRVQITTNDGITFSIKTSNKSASYHTCGQIPEILYRKE